MSLLTAETFSLQFNNRRQRRKKGTYYPKRTYLCYQLTPRNGSTPTRGYFKNKKNCHVEICFIDKIASMELDKTQCYDVTCYLTWSPCPSCAQKLAAFAKAQDHLNLRIFASRLYYHWRRSYQKGLQLLWESQIPVEVMGLPEFTDCWENFVDHGKPPPFNPSEKLQKLGEASQSIKRRLERIKVRRCPAAAHCLLTARLGPTPDHASAHCSSPYFFFLLYLFYSIHPIIKYHRLGDS
uniref:single-stranded DNA cytosine deaminase n=3 Tax=Saimiri boliviensis boliviensis TaxID=39432 RepID=A0A2K6U5H6_SAIBB